MSAATAGDQKRHVAFGGSRPFCAGPEALVGAVRRQGIQPLHRTAAHPPADCHRSGRGTAGGPRGFAPDDWPACAGRTGAGAVQPPATRGAGAGEGLGGGGGGGGQAPPVPTPVWLVRRLWRAASRSSSCSSVRSSGAHTWTVSQSARRAGPERDARIGVQRGAPVPDDLLGEPHVVGHAGCVLWVDAGDLAPVDPQRVDAGELRRLLVRTVRESGCGVEGRRHAACIGGWVAEGLSAGCCVVTRGDAGGGGQREMAAVRRREQRDATAVWVALYWR